MNTVGASLLAIDLGKFPLTPNFPPTDSNQESDI
jgi:hypothetical protein